MKVHSSITIDRLVKSVKHRQTSLANPGFCIKCGKKQDGCEPDARKYECEHCGEKSVYGDEELLMLLI